MGTTVAQRERRVISSQDLSIGGGQGRGRGGSADRAEEGGLEGEGVGSVFSVGGGGDEAVSIGEEGLRSYCWKGQRLSS